MLLKKNILKSTLDELEVLDGKGEDDWRRKVLFSLIQEQMTG